MAEKQQDLSVIYGVRIRRTQNSRLVVEIVRDSYTKQLCHLSGVELTIAPELLEGRTRIGGKLVFASKKPRLFLDAADEHRILRECRDFTDELRIGSVELGLHLFKGPRIEVRYVSGEVFGVWEPTSGLRLTKDAHPALAGDKKHIAKICSELPQGGGGIFQGEPEEPTI